MAKLSARVREKPRTKAGQVRQAWPEIKKLSSAGHSLKDIWAWVNEIGIEIGYARLSHYIGQLRRNEMAEQYALTAGQVHSSGNRMVAHTENGDPSQTARELGRRNGHPLIE